jgi:hypothetical protein
VALGLGFAGLSSTAASAAVGEWTPQGTTDPYYLYSLDTGEVIPEGTQLTYTSGVVAAPSTTNPDQRFTTAPTDAEGVKVFIAPRGQEAVMSNWGSSYNIFFAPGERAVTQPSVTLSQFPASSFAAVKAAGGDYSIGFAYTKNNGVTYVGMGSFAHVTLTAGTAAWTHKAPTAVVVNPPATGSPGEIGIEASVAAPIDGAFSLSIPTGAKATLGTPAWVNNLSTSTGTLPTFSVTDERRVSKKGWDATASVANFARSGGTETIGAENLRVAPKTVTGGTSTGVVAASAFQAATTAQPFASAPAGSGLGLTNLSADLTFAAPAGSVEGTYTSKLTVTVVSK